MLSYLIVGSGYRAEYYGRAAKTYSGLFRALFLCRSEEKALLMEKRTGVSGTISPDEALSFRPDFIVIAVDRPHVADAALEWIERGYPVLTETPVGDTEEKLDLLWQRALQGAKIVCCEQYHRYPILSAGLRAVAEGKIGAPSSAYISLLHDYHAASILRRALLIRRGEGYVLRGKRTVRPIVETDSRYGAILDNRVSDVRRDAVHISYDSGKEAIYDFSSVQYRTFIQSRHLCVRGGRGEWTDTVILFADADGLPERTFLLPGIPEEYRCLDTQALRDKRRNWLFELAPDTVQDEFAIASILLDMGAYLRGGPAPYPLWEALDDAYFWLLLERAVQNPWQEIASRPKPWHEAP